VSSAKSGIPWRSLGRSPATFPDLDFLGASFRRGGGPFDLAAVGAADFPGEAVGVRFAAAGAGFAPSRRGAAGRDGAAVLAFSVAVFGFFSAGGATFFFFFPLGGVGGDPPGFLFRPRSFRARLLGTGASSSGSSAGGRGDWDVSDFRARGSPGAGRESPEADGALFAVSGRDGSVRDGSGADVSSVAPRVPGFFSPSNAGVGGRESLATDFWVGAGVAARESALRLSSPGSALFPPTNH